MRFLHRFEELYQSGASDLEVSKFLSKEYKSYKSSLEKLKDEPITRDFIFKHTRELEEYIISIYKYVLRDTFCDYLPPINSIPIAFYALGSFGREELSIYSDIDVMVVYKELKGFNLKPIIQRCFYLLWDAGIKIGHRAHEVAELFEAANSDHTIKSAFIESRFFYGSRFLNIEVSRELNRIKRSNQELFFEAKLSEQKERYKKYPISVEPNLKEGVGGLRDINLLFWILSTRFFIHKLKDLSGTFFSDDEFSKLAAAQEFLLKTRVLLHILSGKKNDTLYFQYQRDIALALGFRDKRTKRAEVSFMSKLLASLYEIEIFCNTYISKALRYKKVYPIASLKQSRLKDGIYLISNRLYATFRNRPIELEELLELLYKLDNVCFDYSFIKLLSKLEKPKKSGYKRAFFRLFQKESISSFLELFFKSGILRWLVPHFQKIEYLSQFDGYHQYSVDYHSIICVKMLDELPDGLAKELFASFDIQKKAFLRLIAFYHDLGKGRYLDHSEVGSRLFRVFAKQCGLEHELIEKGAILIRYHTSMSYTAFREDIYSETTLLRFVANLGSKEMLDYLYVLTVADILATSRTLLTKFSTKLLDELYFRSIQAFDKKELISLAFQRSKKERALKANSEFLAFSQDIQKKVFQIKSDLFFIKNSTKEIVELVKKAIKESEYEFWYENTHGFVLHLMMKRELNLGWLLERLAHLNLVSMDIYRLFDRAKYFRLEFEEPILDEELNELEKLVVKSLDMSKRTQIKVSILKNEIELIDNHSQEYALFKLHCKDQRGLMAYLIDIFDEFKIDIATAKVMTVHKRARDIFLIQKNDEYFRGINKALEKITTGANPNP